MFLVLTEMSTFTSIIKLFLLLVLFFVLLYGAHLFTKWYAKSGYVNAKSSNIQIIETQRSEERRVGKECRSRWSPYH